VKDQKDSTTGRMDVGERRCLRRPFSKGSFLGALMVAALVLMPLKTLTIEFASIGLNVSKVDAVPANSAGLNIPVVDFSFAEAHAADRRGGRSGNRGGRAGGKGADRRGLDRDDTPGASVESDSASSSSNGGRSGTSSDRGDSGPSSEASASNGSSNSSETEAAEAGGRDANEGEGGDLSPRSWFSIDASDMDTLNVGVISSKMGRDAAKPEPDLCMALVCDDIR